MKSFLKTFFLPAICLMNLTGLHAQKTEDVVYLKNGSIIHGKILADSSFAVVRIINHAGDTWVFNLSDVDSVKKEKTFEYKAIQFNRRGFEMNTNAELIARSGSNAIGNAIIPGINVLLGYRFNRFLSAGTQAGIEFYTNMEIPVTVEVKLRPGNRALSPLVFMRAGYTFPAEKRPDDYQYRYDSNGGIHYSTGLGIERIINENASFLFTFSYHYQELNYHLTPLYQWLQERDRTEAYSRIRITLGYVFK